MCPTQLAGCVLLKKIKYFEVMLNIFELSRVWEIAESWFLDWNKETKLMPPSFSCFLDFPWKNKVPYKVLLSYPL